MKFKLLRVLSAILFVLAGTLANAWQSDSSSKKANPPAKGATAAPAKEPREAPQAKIAEIPKTVRDEIERLISDDPAKRATAAASLGQMGQAAAPAIPYLAAALDDWRSVLSLRKGNVEVREIVLDTLKPLGEPARREILARLSRPSDVRGGAIWAVSELRETRAIPLLTTILLDRAANLDDLRVKALEALDKIQGQPTDLATLLPFLDSAGLKEAPALANEIVKRIVAAKDKRGIPALIILIPSSRFEYDAIHGLGLMHDPSATDALIQALKGKKQALIYIASALAETDDPRAVSPLITALAELKDYGDNQNNPGSVREALTKLTGQKLSRLEEWQEWLKKNEARFPR